MPTARVALWFAVGILLIADASPVCAGDWPQILGPTRTGVAADDERLLDTWPAEGPKVTWSKEVGAGYAGIVVAGSKALLYHRLGDSDVLEALDAATGKALWKESNPTTFVPGVGSGDGPLCMPTVAGDRVVTFSPQGLLVVRELETGKLVWQRDTFRDYGGQEGYFGAGNTPLVTGGIVVVNVGGAKAKAAVVGFDLKTGQTLWTQLADQASYSTPILFREGDRELVVVITRLQCVALEPATGKLIWQTQFGQRGPTVNGAAPVRVRDKLFLTASYGIGAVLLDPNPDSVDVLWMDTEILSSQYATPIAEGDLLFGFHGRDDIPPTELRCVDPFAPLNRNRVVWSVPDFGYGTMIQANGRYVIVKTDGEVILADLTREKYAPRSSFRALPSTIRALPALANGGLFLRDETTLKRFEVGQPSSR